MSDLEILGYRIVLGLDVPPLSYAQARRALAAMQLHREYHEVDVHRLIARANINREEGRR